MCIPSALKAASLLLLPCAVWLMALYSSLSKHRLPPLFSFFFFLLFQNCTLAQHLIPNYGFHSRSQCSFQTSPAISGHQRFSPRRLPCLRPRPRPRLWRPLPDGCRTAIAPLTSPPAPFASAQSQPLFARRLGKQQYRP